MAFQPFDLSGRVALITGSSNFATTIDGNDQVMTGPNDGFFSMLNATGSSLTYSTFLGGTGQDRGKVQSPARVVSSTY